MVGSGAPPADPEDTLPTLDAPLRGMDDLLVLFHDAEKPRERWRIGTEAERIAVRTTDGAHLPYAGAVSVETIFDHLIREYGWEPEREKPGGFATRSPRIAPRPPVRSISTPATRTAVPVRREPCSSICRFTIASSEPSR